MSAWWSIIEGISYYIPLLIHIAVVFLKLVIMQGSGLHKASDLTISSLSPTFLCSVGAAFVRSSQLTVDTWFPFTGNFGLIHPYFWTYCSNHSFVRSLSAWFKLGYIYCLQRASSIFLAASISEGDLRLRHTEIPWSSASEFPSNEIDKAVSSDSAIMGAT